MDFIYTIIAYLITGIIIALFIRSGVKEEEKQNKIENEKEKRLKFFLDRCAESRKNDQN